MGRKEQMIVFASALFVGKVSKLVIGSTLADSHQQMLVKQTTNATYKYKDYIFMK